MFLVGLYVGKRRIHDHLSERRAILSQTVKLALPCGIAATACALVWTVSSKDPLGTRIFHRFVGLLGGDLQSLGYAATLSLLAIKHSTAGWARMLACYGQMPLTQYLTQWLLMRLLFDRFFLALGGKVGPSMGVVITVAIYLVQWAGARWWLKRFQFGPAEWLWKTLSYLRRQPLRARSAIVPSEAKADETTA